MSSYFDTILSKYQCGFRKGYSAQHCLIAMLEKWRKSLDKNGSFGALTTDLSKAFDCLVHDLLIAKLHAYGFDKASLTLVYNYLTDRKQRVKLNTTYSSWREILYGVPQGSILGPLLFNIYLCDLFFIIDNVEIASYADDTTPYSCAKDMQSVISSLEMATTELFSWFANNSMKSNAEKCHLILSTNENISANIEGLNITNSKCEKLLGIEIEIGELKTSI